uniref:Fibulin-7-like n=1 Tax=Stegastes partitus TaxID=144197 RepID=A0A3B4YZT7_9TELE
MRSILNLFNPSVLFQDCPSRQEIQGSLKQVQKLLSAHEASYLQSLRNLKKKINLLQSAAGKQTTKAINSTCPKLDAPLNGRKLGKSHGVGHEVHFLCDPGYELVGAESRVCQESLTWSGQQPACRDINECASSPCTNGGTCVDELNQFSCICAKGWAGVTCQTTAAASTLPAATAGPFVRPSRCTTVQGTTHCTCEPGYTISGRDSNICTDIDECELFHNGQAGRLCLHACVNTAGGYRCSCPAGYNVTRDGRSCKDIDECATRQNNCTKDQMCINTYGAFQCAALVSLPQGSTIGVESVLKVHLNSFGYSGPVIPPVPSSVWCPAATNIYKPGSEKATQSKESCLSPYNLMFCLFSSPHCPPFSSLS